MKYSFTVTFVAVVAIAAAVLYVNGTFGTASEISSFEECVAAGNPVMESHPRQCRDPVSGETFIEEIEYQWKLDGIELRQHENEGFYGCFGCSTPAEGPAFCIDPVPEMKQVEETPERHCNSDFEVVE
jgi:hypothetical protein